MGKRRSSNKGKEVVEIFRETSFISRFGSFALIVSADKFDFEQLKRSREHSLIRVSDSGSGSGSGNDWPWNRDDEGKVHKSKEQFFTVKVDRRPFIQLENLGFHPDVENSYFSKEFVGSCNGLVCLYGQDFEVVLITGFRSMIYRPGERTDCMCRLQIYSLATDSWRFLELINSLPGDPFPYPSQGLYLNGCFLFMAKYLRTKEELEQKIQVDDRLIISFDFTTTFITPIVLPAHHIEQKLYLTSLGDKMVLFIKCYRNETHYEDYNIWVKKHGSVNQEWTKLYSFQIVPTGIGECNVPIGISDDEEFALLETSDSTTGFGKRIKLYQLATKEVKISFLSCSVVMSKAIAYKPSQVSIIGGYEDDTSRNNRKAKAKAAAIAKTTIAEEVEKAKAASSRRIRQ